MKWFVNVKTLDELRTMYRKLAMEHHPDRGGSTRDMQEINAEYEILSQRLINSNPNFSESRKHYEHYVSEEIRQKLNEVIFLEDVTIEVIGSWIWISGNTRPIKEELKQKGFKFSPNKTAWYWYYGEYHKFSKRRFSMDDIRAMWGSEEVETQRMKSQIA